MPVPDPGGLGVPALPPRWLPSMGAGLGACMVPDCAVSSRGYLHAAHNLSACLMCRPCACLMCRPCACPN